MDKRVMMYTGDFHGIKAGDLVRLKSGINVHGFQSGDVALVIDRVANALMLGDGDGEYYDLIFVVVNRGRRHHVSVQDVEKIQKDDIEN